jgi:hypothetical protein
MEDRQKSTSSMKHSKFGAAAIGVVLFVALTAIPALNAQQSQNQQKTQDDSMPGMHMGDSQKDAQKDPAASPQTEAAANEEMSMKHMDMGPHMYMTALRPSNPADEKRAQEIVDQLRPALVKYKDYHVALDEGFKIFHPELPQDHYHFTNYSYALAAQFHFDPTKPTSLLYKKTADGYELEGAMYTAPKRYDEEELNERIPLSVARWHEHVNFCLPPKGTPITIANWHEFGLKGSIVTEDACNAANGRWLPVVFNWMVHVYPFETDPAKIWAH